MITVLRTPQTCITTEEAQKVIKNFISENIYDEMIVINSSETRNMTYEFCKTLIDGISKLGVQSVLLASSHPVLFQKYFRKACKKNNISHN